MRTGECGVDQFANVRGALVDRQPFGGFKLSGIGSKAGGPDYLLLFTQAKSVATKL